MNAIEIYLLQIYHFFAGNWIASGILAVIVIAMAIKNPTLLFKIVASIVGALAVLYILIFLESALFSGVDSKERAIEVERQSK